MNAMRLGSDSLETTPATHSRGDLTPRSNGRNSMNVDTNDKVRATRRLARIAGVLYLLVGIFGGFAEGFVEPKMYVAGDAAATAANLLANSGLVRIAVVADLLDPTIFVFLGMTLYLLLKHVNKNVASAMVVLVAIST